MRRYARPILVFLTVTITAAYSLWYFSPSFAVSPPETVDVELGGRKILAMPGEVAVYHNPRDLRQAAADGRVAMSRRIDFSQQKLVRVGWRAMGYASHDAAGAVTVGRLSQISRIGGREIHFFIDQPLQGGSAGQPARSVTQHQRVGESWFLVDRDAVVSYSEFAPPLKFDLLVLLLMFVVVHLAVWPWVRPTPMVERPALEPARRETVEWAAGG